MCLVTFSKGPHDQDVHTLIIVDMLIMLLKMCCAFSGIFFVLPCIETYQRVDLRTITLDVPPQEVKNNPKK